jgi:hypothetical protein
MINPNLAEESGGGKIILLKRGGYADMDACIMYYDTPKVSQHCAQPHNFFPRCHPGPGIPHSSSVGTSIAMQQIDVEYFGHRFVVLLQCRS